MDFIGIIKACAAVGVIGLVIGILLGIAGKIFAVQVDEKEEKIREVLPGNNCGGCGYPGCDGLAAAIAKGEASADKCPVGGPSVAAAIGEITGNSVEVIKKVAFVKCSGDCESAKKNYEYTGNESCIDAFYVTGGGPKACSYGCTGFGSCVKVCEFDAIHVVDGVAVVDRSKCVACGKCVNICPKKLIELVPFENKYHVACNSSEKGALVRKVCSKGCIGCMICAKNCPSEAVTVTDFLAHIDTEKCINCGVCSEKCPQKVIESYK